MLRLQGRMKQNKDATIFMSLPVHSLFTANTDCNLKSVDTGVPNTGVHNVILCIAQFCSLLGVECKRVHYY
jgi:hypothetical protein